MTLPVCSSAQQITTSFPNRNNPESDTLFTGNENIIKIEPIPVGAGVKIKHGKIQLDKKDHSLMNYSIGHDHHDSFSLGLDFYTIYNNKGGLTIKEPQHMANSIDSLFVVKGDSVLFSKAYKVVSRERLMLQFGSDSNRVCDMDSVCRYRISVSEFKQQSKLTVTPSEYGYYVFGYRVSILPREGEGVFLVPVIGNEIYDNLYKRGYKPKSEDRLFINNIIIYCKGCRTERTIGHEGITIRIE